MTQWAMGRVNSFIQGGKARQADADIYSKNQKLDINQQVKKFLNQIKKAKDKESVETAFDEIHKLILKKNDYIKMDHINELYEIEKKYGTQLKKQIHKKPETYLETYTSSMPKDLKEKISSTKEQEKSMLESVNLRPLLEKYSMILPP